MPPIICLVKRHMISTTYEHSFFALGGVLQDYPMRWVSWYDFRNRCVSQSNSSRPGVATIKSPYETMMKDNKLPWQTISLRPNTSQFALWKYLAIIAKINTRLEFWYQNQLSETNYLTPITVSGPSVLPSKHPIRSGLSWSISLSHSLSQWHLPTWHLLAFRQDNE